jgi:succinyl-diaminopimelate desuccinylase
MKPGEPHPSECSRLLQWLRAHQGEMAAFLVELIAIPTSNPPGKNYRKCTDLLQHRIEKFGMECLRLEFLQKSKSTEETPVCLLASYGKGSRALYFHGHYDVVPAQSFEQFYPHTKDHFVFGRGACDMKGGVVAMLYAIRALQECGITPGGRIGLTLVPDEETGGGRGSAWLAGNGVLGRDGIGMLSAEPTSGVVWNANRGAFSLRVNVRGKSAHVGLQHQGENAFESMLRVLANLNDLKIDVEGHLTSCDIGRAHRRNSILLLGGESGGGTNFNMVPESCWFTLDRRTNPEEDLEAEKAKIIAILEDCRRHGFCLNWEVLQEGKPSLAGDALPLAMALKQSVRTVSGKVPRFEMCPGLLENRFYSELGIPAYCYGPGQLSVAHGPNEFVDLRKVVDSAGIYALTAIEALGC